MRGRSKTECKASTRASETAEETVARPTQNRMYMASMRASETAEETVAIPHLHCGKTTKRMIIDNRAYQLNRVQIHHYLGKTEVKFPRF